MLTAVLVVARNHVQYPYHGMEGIKFTSIYFRSDSLKVLNVNLDTGIVDPAWHLDLLPIASTIRSNIIIRTTSTSTCRSTALVACTLQSRELQHGTESEYEYYYLVQSDSAHGTRVLTIGPDLGQEIGVWVALIMAHVTYHDTEYV
eukprot:SAG11_NODE_9_length_28972_cov_81.532539_4_plen_146_part_00